MWLEDLQRAKVSLSKLVQYVKLLVTSIAEALHLSFRQRQSRGSV